MVISHQEYLEQVRRQLSRALCIYNVPSLQPEHPEVEFPGGTGKPRPPITVRRGPQECCLVETSINSARISLKIKQIDETERWLTKRWIAFLTQASYAEAFGILRRVPVAGFDLSFVITVQHCLTYGKESLLDFICHFIHHTVGATELKMLINSRGRAVATSFLSDLAT